MRVLVKSMRAAGAIQADLCQPAGEIPGELEGYKYVQIMKSYYEIYVYDTDIYWYNES